MWKKQQPVVQLVVHCWLLHVVVWKRTHISYYVACGAEQHGITSVLEFVKKLIKFLKLEKYWICDEHLDVLHLQEMVSTGSRLIDYYFKKWHATTIAFRSVITAWSWPFPFRASVRRVLPNSVSLQSSERQALSGNHCASTSRLHTATDEYAHGRQLIWTYR